MKILPTWSALWHTIYLALFVGSLLTNVVALWGWYICNSKWDEILDTAKFNDLDGDGVSNVIIIYK